MNLTGPIAVQWIRRIDDRKRICETDKRLVSKCLERYVPRLNGNSHEIALFLNFNLNPIKKRKQEMKIMALI